jgi:hypothetical protein
MVMSFVSLYGPDAHIFADANPFLLFFGFYPVFAGHLNRESAFTIRNVQHTSLSLAMPIKNTIYFPSTLRIVSNSRHQEQTR